MERQYTRVDTIRQYVDGMLNSLPDPDERRAGFDEILKDADEMQHWLRNPMEEYYFRKDRTQRVVREFGLLS